MPRVWIPGGPPKFAERVWTIVQQNVWQSLEIIHCIELSAKYNKIYLFISIIYILSHIFVMFSVLCLLVLSPTHKFYKYERGSSPVTLGLEMEFCKNLLVYISFCIYYCVTSIIYILHPSTVIKTKSIFLLMKLFAKIYFWKICFQL